MFQHQFMQNYFQNGIPPPPRVLSSAASERPLPGPHFTNSCVSSSIHVFHYLQLLVLFNELLYNFLQLSLIFLYPWVKEKSNIAMEFSKPHHLTAHISLANRCIHAWQVVFIIFPMYRTNSSFGSSF